MMQKETTHRVWVIFTGRLLSRASCSIRQVYHTHTATASISRSEQEVRWETGYEEAMFMLMAPERWSWTKREKKRGRNRENGSQRKCGGEKEEIKADHLNTDRNVETQAFTFIRVWECWSSVSPVVFTNTEPTWLTLHPASPGHQRLPLAAWWDCPRSASSAACEDRETWLEVVETERRETEEETERFQCEYFRVWLLLVSSINLLSSPSIHWLDGCSVLCGQQYKTQRRTVCTHKIKQTKETHFYIWEAGTRESLAFVSIIEKQTRLLACWLLQSPHEADWKT